MDTIVLLLAALGGFALCTAALARSGGRHHRALALATVSLAAGVAVLGWQAPTGKAQPTFDRFKDQVGNMPQVPPGLLNALKQFYPNAVGITVVNNDGSAEYLATGANQPIYDVEPTPRGQKVDEETITRLTYEYNPTCVWQYVGGRYMLVSGDPNQCIQQ